MIVELLNEYRIIESIWSYWMNTEFLNKYRINGWIENILTIISLTVYNDVNSNYFY